MSHEAPKDLKPRRVRVFKWALLLGWTATVAGLSVRDVARVRHVTQDMAVDTARANFNKDQAIRHWAASHGGVYVPTNERTPPNPYLTHVKERDIETPSGVKLTLMNPAYLMRQMNEDFSHEYGIVGHITSLKLLRPENAPDDWERAALESFERGVTEVTEVVLTTTSAERDVEACYEIGASSYIQKPVDMEGYMRAIQLLKEYWFEIVLIPKANDNI